MADERVRTHERRWRETGAREDEAAWLRERVRVGDLPVERFRLWLALGHEDWPAPQKLIYAFDPCGPEAWRRSAVALAASLAPHFAEEHPDVWQPATWLVRAEDFILHRPVEAALGCQFGPSWRTFEDHHHDVDWEAYEETCRGFASERAWHAYSVLRLIRSLPEWRDASEASGVLMAFLDGMELTVALSVLRGEVVPWLLGDGDPVRDRAEARQRQADGAGAAGDGVVGNSKAPIV